MIPELNPRRVTHVNKTSEELKGSILVDYECGAMLVRADSIHARVRETHFPNAGGL